MSETRASIAILAALIVCLPLGARAEPELVIVVSSSLDGADRLDASTLRRLYLGRQTQLAGVAIECHALPPGGRARDTFNREVLNRDEDELADYWIEQALRGGSLPPTELETPEALIARIRSRSHAIGYLLRERDAPAPEGVRIFRLRR